MPKITINEDNLTRPTSTAGTDIVLIPGFSTEVTSDTLKYCSSVKDFEEKFGNNPHIFTSAQTIGDAAIVGATEPDKSYIMAKELLAAGMPVYYYGIAAGTNVTSIDNIITGIKFGAENIVIPGSSLSVSHNFDTSAEITVYLSKTLIATDKLKVTCNHSKYTVSINTTGAELDDDEEHYTNLTGNTLGLTLTRKSDYTPEDGTIDPVTLKVSYENTVTSGASLVTFYEKVKRLLNNDDLSDKSEYTFKYITTGGYPNFGHSVCNVYSNMLSLAEDRGDCIALVEGIHTGTLENVKEIYEELKETIITNGEYGAAFAPWAVYNLSTENKDTSENILSTCILPACYGYLATLASSIKVSPNWLAMAGTTRGLVPKIKELNLDKPFTNKLAETFQPIKSQDGLRAVNPITEIKPYGLAIWGNRTLKTIDNGLDATHFLNTRNMISDIKKVAYRVAKGLMFEQKDEILWLNFKSQMSPFLEQLKSGSGISDYKLIKLDTRYSDGGALGKEEFACGIKIYPIQAVESFEITVVISDSSVGVEG